MIAPAPLAPVLIRAESPRDQTAVDGLVMAAFGPGRYAKTAERLREAAGLEIGFVAEENAVPVGSVRLWRITVGQTPALFLGPIAVEAARRRAGLGADLVQACVDHARSSGHEGVLLVGDAPYFARFGFVRADRAVLPGPADPNRVLWLGLGSATAEGAVRPAA